MERSLITQQILDEIIEKRELAKPGHGVDSNTLKDRKKEYKALRSKYDKQVTKKVLDKLLRDDKRAIDHLQ